MSSGRNSPEVGGWARFLLARSDAFARLGLRCSRRLQPLAAGASPVEVNNREGGS